MNDKILSLAYSPCPNDTFMFHDIALGDISLPGCDIDVHICDVETLNLMAVDHKFDITKLSVYAFLKVGEDYEMLSSGAALGYGSGPLVVSRSGVDIDLSESLVAVPGELTTAHLLFRLWAGEAKEIRFMPFDKIMPAVLNGEVDAGVVIHEGRFVYEQLGLRRLADLGEWWEAETAMPLPLGCIAARKTLGRETIDSIDVMVRRSIESALSAPEKTYDYVRQYAQELEEAVFLQHIDAFVNEFSVDMGDKGREAVALMIDMALNVGML